MTSGHDAAATIYSNEMAKRAVVVAAAGNHTLLLFGPPNCGKTMMRAAALELGLAQGEEISALAAPSGYQPGAALLVGTLGGKIQRMEAKKAPTAGKKPETRK